MKIAIAQLNPTIGDILGNSNLILEAAKKAEVEGANLLLTPELSLIGYPPRDLLLNPSFIAAAGAQLQQLAQALPPKLAVIAGTVVPNANAVQLGGKSLFNSAVLLQNGAVKKVFHKRLLPTYDVFDEDRYFEPGENSNYFTIGELKIGVTICEDLWNNEEFWGKRSYPGDPVSDLVKLGQDLVGSNQQSAAGIEAQPLSFYPAVGDAEIWAALVLGVRDYVRKCGFSKVVLGLSGGIDSGLVAAIASCAIGPENVLGVLMPSPYSSDHSVNDALELARNLGIAIAKLPIGDLMKTYDRTLADLFVNTTFGIAEENIQSRIRGNLLMAISNKFGHLLLSTGNKSEMSVGYCTLYGDMNGGLAVIFDLPKI